MKYVRLVAAIFGYRLVQGCAGTRSSSDVAEQVERYGAGLALPDWAAQLVCSKCGSRAVDFVVSGARR